MVESYLDLLQEQSLSKTIQTNNTNVEAPTETKPEAIYNLKVSYITGFVSPSISDKCKIKTLAPNKWLYCFEDTGWFGTEVKWDWDEPVIEIEKLNGNLKFTIREWEGAIPGDIYFGNTILFPKEALPSMLQTSAGLTKTIYLTDTEDTGDTAIIKPLPEEKSWWEKFWELQPWYIKLAIVGGIILSMYGLAKTTPVIITALKTKEG